MPKYQVDVECTIRAKYVATVEAESEEDAAAQAECMAATDGGSIYSEYYEAQNIQKIN